MSEKTQFTPEDVGRKFETSKEGVTAKLIKWDYNVKTDWKCLFELSNDEKIWSDYKGEDNVVHINIKVFPSRPVEEAPSQPTMTLKDLKQLSIGELIERLRSLDGKIIGYPYVSEFISRFEILVTNKPQPTIDTEVEELSRELYVNSIALVDINGYAICTPKQTFDDAEKFIKFRNERRAGK